MAKLTLADVSNILGNPTSAANTINSNSTLIENALENTLSRNGATPNQMLSDIDMNNNDILGVKSLDVDSLTINVTDGLVLTAAAPRLLITDTTSGSDCEILVNTTTGGLTFRADQNNEVANTSYIWSMDGGGKMFLTSTGLGINDSIPDYGLDVNGTLGFTPGASVTPVDNGDVVFQLTSNTQLTIKAKGSDGVIRSANITLA